MGNANGGQLESWNSNWQIGKLEFELLVELH